MLLKQTNTKEKFIQAHFGHFTPQLQFYIKEGIRLFLDEVLLVKKPILRGDPVVQEWLRKQDNAKTN
jgi:hypothetical protein